MFSETSCDFSARKRLAAYLFIAYQTFRSRPNVHAGLDLDDGGQHGRRACFADLNQFFGE